MPTAHKITATSNRWILRLFGPLLGWSLLSLALWKGTGFLSVCAGPVLRMVSQLIAYSSCAVCIYLCCKDGPLPKPAWIAGGIALSLVIIRGVALADVPPGLENSILFLAAAPVLGDMVSRLVDKKEYLVPVMVVAAAVDAWSVFFGPSKKLVASKTVQFFTVNTPFIGQPDLSPVPTTGFADWLFVAFLICVVCKFDLSRWKLAPTLILGLGSGFFAVSLLGIPIPLLTTIAPAFVLIYGHEILPSKKELIQLAGFMALFGLAVFLFAWAK